MKPKEAELGTNKRKEAAKKAKRTKINKVLEQMKQ